LRANFTPRRVQVCFSDVTTMPYCCALAPPCFQASLRSFLGCDRRRTSGGHPSESLAGTANLCVDNNRTHRIQAVHDCLQGPDSRANPRLGRQPCASPSFRWVCLTLALVRQLIAVRRGNGVVVQVARFGCCVRWHWVEEALLESHCRSC
jgi:hypothetical protein